MLLCMNPISSKKLLLQSNTNRDLAFKSRLDAFMSCFLAVYPGFSAFILFSAGILQHPDGTVLKQLQPPPRGPRELQFYNMVILYIKNNVMQFK